MTHATEEAAQQEGLAGQASAKVEDAASAAQEKASELREQGAARLRDQFDRRSNDAGSQLRSLAEAMRRSGSELEGGQNGTAAQLTGQAAERIDRFGSYLEQKRGDDLMRDVEAIARRRPWMLAALGMLAGVAAARFVKASSERRYERGRTSWDAGAAGGTRRPELEAGHVDEPLARDPYSSSR